MREAFCWERNLLCCNKNQTQTAKHSWFVKRMGSSRTGGPWLLLLLLLPLAPGQARKLCSHIDIAKAYPGFVKHPPVAFASGQLLGATSWSQLFCIQFTGASGRYKIVTKGPMKIDFPLAMRLALPAAWFPRKHLAIPATSWEGLH